MGIFRGSIVIGAVATAAFLNLPAIAENTTDAEQQSVESKSQPAADQQAEAKQPVIEPAKETADSKSEEESPKNQPLFRHATYPAAWSASQKSNRPILLYVSTNGCPHCDKMMAESYHKPEMKQMISESFEPVYVTRKAHPKLVKSLKVRWYPTTVLVGPNNKIMDVIEGYVDSKIFRRRLQTGLSTAKTPVKTR